jgi:hypothetical protein
MLRTLLLLVAAILAAIGVQAAEDEGSKRYEYALDESTELSLEPRELDSKSWDMELRRYGAATEGVTLLFMGELKATGGDIYECTNDYDGTARTVRVSGKPGADQPLEITTTKLQLDSGVPLKIAGLFRPITAADRLGRATERWHKADKVLNEVYARLLKEVGKAGAPKLRELQRARIEMRDQRAAWNTKGADHPDRMPAYWDTMLDYTVSNLELLRIYTGREIAKGWSGRYRDIGGGLMEIEQTKKGLKFSITAVRKMSDANGEIAGIARLQGDRAGYKEALTPQEKKEQDREPAELVFILSGGHKVKVEEKNTDYFGGAGVYFAGDYFKLGPLKEPLDVAE